MDLKETIELARYILKENVVKVNGKYIFTANPGNEDNYHALWTRDAVYCILASLTTDDELLIRASLDSFDLLFEYQTDLGRVPAYISLKNIEDLKPEYGGWGRIETLDSQMWYVIAAKKIYEYTNDNTYVSDQRMTSYLKAVDFLNYRTAGSAPYKLVDWPLSSGWDDQMQRHHHVTSLECLRVIAKNDLITLLKTAGKEDLVDVYQNRLAQLKKAINDNLWITPENVDHTFANDSMEYGPGYFSVFANEIADEIKNNYEKYQFYQSYLAPYKISLDHIKRFDSYANLLAVISGTANHEKSKKIIDHILQNKINEPYPLKTLFPVIKKGEIDYHRFYSAVRNSPHSYQNGGIWPHISSIYIKLLIDQGNKKFAEEELKRMVKMVTKPGYIHEYSFSEYYNGDTGDPGKRAHEHQAWSASGIIYSNYLLNNTKVEMF